MYKSEIEQQKFSHDSTKSSNLFLLNSKEILNEENYYFFTIALLSGCMSAFDSMNRMVGIGNVTQEVSTFDNATVINASPAPLWREGSWYNFYRLGAVWSSNSPDYVALVLSYQTDTNPIKGKSYTNFEALHINIDGEIYSFKTIGATKLDSSAYNSVMNTIYTSSTNTVVIPYDVLKRMINAKDCRLRIQTLDDYEDAQFSIERIPGAAQTAIVALRELTMKADALRGN